MKAKPSFPKKPIPLGMLQNSMKTCESFDAMRDVVDWSRSITHLKTQVLRAYFPLVAQLKGSWIMKALTLSVN